MGEREGCGGGRGARSCAPSLGEREALGGDRRWGEEGTRGETVSKRVVALEREGRGVES